MIIDGIKYESKVNGWALVANISNYNSHVILPQEINSLPIIEIANTAFSDGEDIETLEIPDTVQCIGMYAFSGCRNLKTVVERKTNFKLTQKELLLRDGAFIGCSRLKSVMLNKCIVLAGKSVFQRCHHLEQIGERNQIYGVRVPDFCFQACVSLEYLTFMSNSVELGNNVFNWCTALKTLTFWSQIVDCDYNDTWDSLRGKKIICTPTCNLANLAYDGVDIQIAY